MDLRKVAEAADIEAVGHGGTSMGRWLAHVAAECRAGAVELDAARAEIERLRGELAAARCANHGPHEAHDYPLTDPEWEGPPAWHCPGRAAER